MTSSLLFAIVIVSSVQISLEAASPPCKAEGWMPAGKDHTFLRCDMHPTTGQLYHSRCGCDTQTKKDLPPAFVVCPAFFYRPYSKDGKGFTCMCHLAQDGSISVSYHAAFPQSAVAIPRGMFQQFFPKIDKTCPKKPRSVEEVGKAVANVQTAIGLLHDKVASKKKQLAIDASTKKQDADKKPKEKAAKKQLPENWQEWTHVKLSQSAIYKAKETIMEFGSSREDLRLENFKDATDEKMPPQYNRADWTKERFAPLVKVFMDFEADGYINFAGCSGAFIGPDIVATAAHCLTGGTHITGTSGNAFYVILNLGKTGDTATLASVASDAFLVIEWWYPTQFMKNGGNDKPIASGQSDIAFLKVIPLVEGRELPTTHFHLMPPSGKVGSTEYSVFRDHSMLQIGYPYPFYCQEVMAVIQGHLEPVVSDYENDEEVQKDQVGFQGVEPPKKNLLIAGDMGEGGSGGPWVLSDEGWAALKYPDEVKAQLKMAMFGITSWGPVHRYAFDPRFRMSSSLLISDAVLKAYKKILKVSGGENKDPVGDTVKLAKREAGKSEENIVEMVKFNLEE